MKKSKIIIFVLMVFLMTGSSLMAQSKIYEGPDDPAGDISAEREGWMNGNRVLLLFQNNTELSGWPRMDASRWPDTYEGRKMNDGVGLLIGARVYIKEDSIPVTDLNEIATLSAAGELDTLFYCQTSYRENMDTNPNETVEWGLYPVSEYQNLLGETPALSNNPDSWPVDGWPSRGREKKWVGEWDGRFGRGVISSGLECYFVANDAHDQENLPANNAEVRYYPRPGKYIGDIDPTVTIQKNMPWGGIGTRVEQRGMQWSNPQVRDAIFWEYTIANISDYDLPEVSFGYWVDNAIGGDGAMDELAAFDKVENLSYSWDINGIGAGGVQTGTMGFAYLESPSVSYDEKDNDDDGIIDEKRDNAATSIVGPEYGIQDIQKFLSYYRKDYEDLRDHWDADEDQDWDDGIDSNGDGVYTPDEYAGDDVGTDGVGPTELNYYGPDADGSEGNHRPDYVEGLGSEPDFASTDVSESDMLGLTSFHLYPIQDPEDPESAWFHHDEVMWEFASSDTLAEFIGEISNLIEIFASAVFPIYQGRTERISMAELHSFDPLSGLQSSEHLAPALFQLKYMVQIVYESDYRFAQPPKMPTLTATPGYESVILTWNNVADTKTREPLLNNINDFEGYKLYRATDPKMSDPEVITDGYGSPLLMKPIFECDIKDGRTGFANYGTVEDQGAAVYLGRDSGITHFFEDNTVQNGRTYYYALAAYDYGIPPEEFKGEEGRDKKVGIAPSQNPVIIELDEFENIKFIGQNVAIVTPGPEAIGVDIQTEYELDDDQILGDGTLIPEVVAINSVKPGHIYQATFEIWPIADIGFYDDHGVYYTTSGVRVHDITEGGENLVYEDVIRQNQEEAYCSDNYYSVFLEDTTLDAWYMPSSAPNYTGVFDGLRLKIETDVITAEYDTLNSGWITGQTPMQITLSDEEYQFFPWDYDIVFTGEDSAYVSRLRKNSVVRDENGVSVKDDILKGIPFSFFVRNRSFIDTTTGEPELMDMVVVDDNHNSTFDLFEDRIVVGPLTSKERWAGTIFSMNFKSLANESEMPAPGDVYQILFNRPFWKEDTVTFSINADRVLDQEKAKNSLDDVEVVPNPYVATNAMEPSVANFELNQRRRIMFMGIPEKCTIKIFTVSGVLVSEIHAPDDGLASFDGMGDVNGGIIHWDLKTREGLEVAAGMYLYHLKDDLTGQEKMGKIAIIK
ncbi:hypothetical protein HQ585_19215 [candidate division KSB1 bacterium]|nr:hypothetical protein [candidate division KSB1 bacterium]